MSMKILLSLMCSVTMATPIVTTITDRSIINSEYDLELSSLIEDIKSKSSLVNNKTIYYKDGKEYESFNEIVDEQLSINPILSELTSSNPNKIIKNTATNQLDESKIFTTNVNDMVEIYEDALGKVVLPSCSEANVEGCINTNQMAVDRALQSYVNPAFFKPKYSYTGLNWHDSVNEAENEFKASNFTVKSSLFYFMDGNYYNAFNKKDMQTLLNNQVSGYYYEGFNENEFNNIQNENLKKPFFLKEGEPGSSSESTFRNTFKKYLKEEVKNNLNIDFKYSFTLKAGQNQWFELMSDDQPIPGLKIIPSNPFGEGFESLIFEFSNEARKNLTLDKFFKDVLTNSSYKETGIDSCDAFFWSNDQREYKIFTQFLDTVDSKTNNEFKFKLNTFKDDDSSDCFGPSGMNHVYAERITITKDLYFKNIKITDNKKDIYNELIKKYNIDFNWEEIFRSFATSQGITEKEWLTANSTKTKFENIAQHERDILFNIIYENFWDKIVKYSGEEYEKNNYPIKKDIIYGCDDNSNNCKYSQYESNKEYLRLFKEQNPGNYEDNKELVFSTSVGDFTTTYKNWKDNFTFLQTNTGDDITLTRKYFVDTNTSNDIAKFSDNQGTNIADSYVAAQNIAMNNSTAILRKIYHVYNLQGELTVINQSKEDLAIEELKNKIYLSSSLINKEELKLLENQHSSIESIISNGLYNVYYFEIENDKKLYFKDYQSTYEMYKNQYSLVGGITEEYIMTKSYSIIINNELKVYKYTNKEDITLLAKNILNDLRGE